MITKKDKVIRDERSQDWEVENLSESTLILHSPNIFSSSRLKGSKIIFLWHIYVTLKEKRVAKFIIRLKDEAFQCKWFLVQFDAGQKEALIQANDLFSWFNLLLSRLRHFFYIQEVSQESVQVVLGSPGCSFVQLGVSNQHAENGPIHMEMDVDCALVITSKVKPFSRPGKRNVHYFSTALVHDRE